MLECKKQQRENVKGVEQFRCLNQDAVKHLAVVENHDCEACPVRVLMVKRGCSKTASPQIQLPVIQDGFRACSLRRYTGGPSCSVSGHAVTAESCNRCCGEAAAESQRAGFGAKALAYVDAVKKWIQSGRPTRTKEEIDTIYNDHCKSCARFDAVTNSCKNCGCVISQSEHPLMNKLAMKTESCPLGLWS